MMQVLLCLLRFFFLMIRRPPRSTLDRSSAASDVYKRQLLQEYDWTGNIRELRNVVERLVILSGKNITTEDLSLIHISEPTRPY